MGRGVKGSPRGANARDLAMARLYQDGLTLEQIGSHYGVSRERVRQLLRAHTDVTAEEGGRSVRKRERIARRSAVQDARFLEKYGCTFAQWQHINRFKKHTYYRSAVGGFLQQRRHAAWRKIDFDLTLLQWWTIWQESGKWEQRGRGQGYVMCRKGDEGPYAIGNIYIALATQNIADGKNKKSGLPLGVRNYKTQGRFVAQRIIAGEKLYLGIHSTPELAHAAYLAAPLTCSRRAAAS